MNLIYSVEDDYDIAKIINKTLTKAGYEVRSFYDGKTFFEAFNRETPQMVLLDMMLPDMDGLEILKRIREVNKELSNLGIPSAVFISSNEENTHGPWPVHDGLPTVEDHRWIPAELQVRHWIAVGDVDEIIFGNAFASEEEFKAIDQVMKNYFLMEK